MLTVGEYAERMKLHPVTVRKMCEEGRLKANKDSSRWRIPYDVGSGANVEAFEEHAREVRRLGDEVERYQAGLRRAIDEYKSACKRLFSEEA